MVFIAKPRKRNRGDIVRLVRQAGLAGSGGASAGDGHGDDRTELITNGTFSADVSWTKTTWTIGSGVASIAAASTDTMTQTIAITPGVNYLVTFTVTSFTAGTVTVILGGTSGTARGSAATFSEVIKAGSANSLINFSASAATLSIDNASIRQMG